MRTGGGRGTQPLSAAMGALRAARSAVTGIARGRRPAPQAAREGRQGLIVFSTMYSLHRLRERRALHTVTYRDLDGYFEHVWSVHPLVGASPDEPPGYGLGPPRATSLNARHTFVEGPIGRFPWLTRFPPLNFLAAQVALLYRLHAIGAGRGAGCVRATDAYYNGLWALLLSRLYGLAFEVFVIGDSDQLYEDAGALNYPRLFRWRWVERRVARFTFSRADLVLVGSSDLEQFALRNGARPDTLATPVGIFSMIDPVHIVPPAERPEPDPALPLNGSQPSIVCVSRLESHKRPDDVLHTLAIARREIPSLTGILVGDGSLRTELEDLSEELGLGDSLLMVGDRDQQWVASVLSRATVILAPLAGMALVEAGLSATPIVAYDTEWHPEALEHGVSGLLVPYRDTEAMAQALCSLVEDPEKARSIGREARDAMLARIDSRTLVERERALSERAFANQQRRRQRTFPYARAGRAGQERDRRAAKGTTKNPG